MKSFKKHKINWFLNRVEKIIFEGGKTPKIVKTIPHARAIFDYHINNRINFTDAQEVY